MVASSFIIVFWDTNKETSTLLSSIDGVRNMATITKKDRKKAMEMKASSSIGENIHASFTVGLVFSQTIWLDNLIVEGQTQSNDDICWVKEILVMGDERLRSFYMGAWFMSQHS